MPAAGTAERDGQVALALRPDSAATAAAAAAADRHERRERRIGPDELLHRRVAARSRAKCLDIVRIVQEADVEARDRPRAAGRCDRRTTSRRSKAGRWSAPKRPASSRRRSGSDRSEVSITMSAAALRGAISSRSAASASATPGASASGWRRRVSVNRRRSTSSSHSRYSRKVLSARPRLGRAPPAPARRETPGAAVDADRQPVRTRRRRRERGGLAG